MTLNNPAFSVQTTLFDLPEQSKPKSNLGVSFDVPSLGATPGLLEQQYERKIGEMVLRQLGKEAPLYEDAWTQDEMMKVFAQIYSNASLGAPVALVMIQDNSINAFAVPGGLFAINTGLVMSARNIDEVAGVIGHEIAHVSQRHYSRSKDAFKNQGLLSLAGMLASILLASQSGDAATAVAIGTQAALIDRQLAYSRNQEREADRVGMYLMNAAGYDPQAMASFFEVMNKKIGTVGFFPDFWLTHPLSSERMSEARLRAAQFPKKTRSLSSIGEDETFNVMQYRIAVLTNQITEARLTSYADRDQGAALALATFYGREGKYEQAREIASKIVSQKPNSSIAAITLAEIELKANQPQRALDVLLPIYRVMPESRALAINVAKAYTAKGEAETAINILMPFSIKNKRDTLIWQAMEAAANRLPEGLSKTLQVLRYRAENQFWRGDMDNAIRSLMQASRIAKDNYALQARIENRIQEMQDDRKFNG